MARPRKQRRNPHGSAWHWKQTDCWYDILPGTKKRVALFDEQGQRVRGADSGAVAELASRARAEEQWKRMNVGVRFQALKK